jgi:GDPmannose 4,6-dehydratase
VVSDPKFFRPADVHTLLGDSSKARRELGWSPTYSFESLVEEMVTEDMRIERSRKD